MYGRGGAGNIAQAAAATTTKPAQDIEAAQPPSTTPSAPTQTPQSQGAPQDYAHMGRGGAGNWFQPPLLSQGGTFSQTATDATAAPVSAERNISKPWTPEGQELPVARQGRGGAGNMVWKSEEAWRREKADEQSKKEEIEREAQVVAGGLKSPGKAVFGSVMGGRGW